MFCANCGKSFEGESFLCPECAAAKEAQAAPQAAELPPVFEPEFTQNSLAQEAPVQQNSLAQEAPIQQNSLAQETPAPEAAPAEAESWDSDPFTVSAPTPAPAKKKFNFKLFGIIAAVLALVGGACFFFFGTDTGKYMTSSPEEYLQEVQQEQVTTYIDGATALYGAFLSSGDIGPIASGTELRVQVGDALLSMAESAGVPADQVSFLKDIRVSTDTLMKDNALRNRFRFSLGETEILQLDAIMDLMTSRIYMAVPALNSQYLSAAIPSAGSINIAQVQTAMTMLREELPSEGDVSDMLNAFSEAALAQIVNVDKAEEMVSVAGVSEKQHVLTATITEGDVIRMAIAVLEEAQKNETFQELVAAMGTYANMLGAGVDLRNEIMTQLPAAIDQLNSMAATASGSTIMLKTYGNHSGEITGRIVTMFSGGPAEEVLRYLSATDDGVTKTEGTVGLYHFTGTKQTTGKVTSGKYTFTVDSAEMFTLDVIETKNQSTEFRVSPGKDLMSNLMTMMGGSQAESADGAAASGSALSPIAGLMAGSMSVSLTVYDEDSDTPGIAVSAQVGGQNLFVVSLTARKISSEDITIPQSYANAEDAEALEAWAENVSFTAVIDKLRAAGVPAELADQLEDLFSGVIPQAETATESVAA